MNRLRTLLREFELKTVVESIKTAGSINRAAHDLGVNTAHLYRVLARNGVRPDGKTPLSAALKQDKHEGDCDCSSCRPWTT